MTKPPVPEVLIREATDRIGDTWPRVWRSLEEHQGPAPDRDAQADDARAEFAGSFSLPEASRRDVLRIMAASLALGAASGCGDASAPSGEAVPYVNQPEQQVPGRPRFYATATLFEGFAQPILVETHEGRPTKIEGNPGHPIGNGSTDAFMQAAVLQFYDPDRSQTVQHRGGIATWGTFERALLDLRQRWDRTGGAGLHLLTGAVTSPTLNRQFDRLLDRWPQARWHGFEPVGSGLRDDALRLAFGEPVSLHHALDKAEVIVSFDEDVLGPGPQQLRNASGWATRRRAALRGDGDCTLHVAGPTPMLTSAMAQRRLPAAAVRVPALVAALAQRLGLAGPTEARLGADERGWIDAAADDLRAHAGRCLVAVGPYQPPESQVLAWRINEALGNWRVTLLCTEPIARPILSENTLGALASDMADGAVEALIVLDANPVYTSFADFDFAELMERVPLRLHAGLFHDETAAHSHWHLPLSHALESWSDARAVDGTITVIQPTVRPLYKTRSPHELIALLLGEPPYHGREIVADTWQAWLRGAESGPAATEERWRGILRAGFIADSAPRGRALALRPAAVPVTAGSELGAGGIEVIFRPDPSIWDGRYANCAWLQELPKPLTKLTWDNVAAISPALAHELGIRDGDRIEITADGHRIEAPAWVLPGQTDRTVTTFLGYGRTHAGRIGDGVGYDAYKLRRASAPWMIAGAQIARLDGRADLATTQTHNTMEGHDIVRLVSLQQARSAGNGATPEPPQPSLYEPWPENQHAWAMAIDLDLCIGCNACVVACQAENNVPSVGKQQVALGREMHWLRIDRYYAGSPDDPETHFMPVPCMHCEKAPCELGCPVNATVHGNGGLNEMVYNRCIGTRTCSSYCPYKVRRFNWFDFTSGAAPSIRAQRNPDVTVRARGVMEKCTYCIQRINAASIDARLENRDIRDGEIVPACQAACPTTAIMFGDANDPESRVSLCKKAPRNYALLEHLGNRPRTTYLARITAAEKSGG